MRGGFHNLTLRATRGHLVRAVLEGVALNARWLAEAVDRLVRRMDPVRLIRRRRPVEAVVPDLRRRPGPDHSAGERPLEANSTAPGSFALVGLGETVGFADVPDLVAIARTFEPTPVRRPIYQMSCLPRSELCRSTGASAPGWNTVGGPGASRVGNEVYGMKGDPYGAFAALVGHRIGDERAGASGKPAGSSSPS